MEILIKSKLSSNGRILTIPTQKEFYMDKEDYKAFKQAMLNIKGIWNGKQEFHFPFSVKNIIERLIDGEDIDLRKLQLFPTPFPLAESMYDALIYQMGFDYKQISSAKILEPSAGTGNIIRYLHSRGADNIDYCEISPEYESILKGECEGININKVGDDFLKTNFKNTYDIVFANPPFNRDTKHLRRMVEAVKPAGYVVTLLGENFANSYLKNDFESIYSDYGISDFYCISTPRCDSKDKEDWVFENTPAGFTLLCMKKVATAGEIINPIVEKKQPAKRQSKKEQSLLLF